MTKLAGKRKPTKRGGAMERYPAWKLEDAKAKFSEVVRRARSEGPQLVTYRGEEAVVVISTEELSKLTPAKRAKPDFLEFIRNSAFGEIEPEREPDFGRDVELP
jgi:prevent-host-death family protein